jgi:hypothetical protein
LTCLGELELVAAAIAQASLPADEPLLLERVDEHHDAAWADTEMLREPLLAQTSFEGVKAKDPYIARLQGQCRQPVREAPCRIFTNLGE